MRTKATRDGKIIMTRTREKDDDYKDTRSLVVSLSILPAVFFLHLQLLTCCHRSPRDAIIVVKMKVSQCTLFLQVFKPKKTAISCVNSTEGRDKDKDQNWIKLNIG